MITYLFDRYFFLGGGRTSYFNLIYRFQTPAFIYSVMMAGCICTENLIMCQENRYFHRDKKYNLLRKILSKAAQYFCIEAKQ